MAMILFKVRLESLPHNYVKIIKNSIIKAIFDLKITKLTKFL